VSQGLTNDATKELKYLLGTNMFAAFLNNNAVTLSITIKNATNSTTTINAECF
jgi:hypothetical protein